MPGTHLIPAIRETFRSAMAERGLDGFQGYNLEGTIQNIDGLADIDFTRHSVPLGGWSDGEFQSFLSRSYVNR